ncbi:hypothetical protein, partial [Burkholderia cenocepacia]|uniref:hypothetical protein n=1 Tax=Burkholderia cenocepacia TaxID=95486 RepID=UPI001B9C2C39
NSGRAIDIHSFPRSQKVSAECINGMVVSVIELGVIQGCLIKESKSYASMKKSTFAVHWWF